MVQGIVNFTLSVRQLRIFRYGLQSLQKIGSELIIEAMPTRFDIRSINSSQSAILSLTYNVQFFDTYDIINCNALHTGILVKNLLSVLRSHRTSQISFQFATEDSKATIVVQCETGLVKTYSVPLMETEVVHAMADKAMLPVTLVAETTAMSRLLSSFQSGAAEITIMASGDQPSAAEPNAKSVSLQSFLDPQKGNVERSLHTRLNVDTHVTFLTYVNNSEGNTDVTFNVKDFRAMLSLCENLGSNITLYFQGPGGPLVVEPHFQHQDIEADYRAELILATLTESFWSSAQDPPVQQAPVPAGNAYNQQPQNMEPGFDAHVGERVVSQEQPVEEVWNGDGREIPNTPPDDDDRYDNTGCPTYPGVIAL